MKKSKLLKKKKKKLPSSLVILNRDQYLAKEKRLRREAKIKQKKRAKKPKFKFTLEFQLEVLRFLLQSKEGVFYAQRIKDYYFKDILHAIISKGITSYMLKYSEVPSRSVLSEVIHQKLNTRSYKDLISQQDLIEIRSLLNDLYSKALTNEKYIKENLQKFIAYVEILKLHQKIDFSDYDQYDDYLNKLSDIIRQSKEDIFSSEPLNMVEDVKQRQIRRQEESNIIPCPWRQLNELTNAGGFSKGSLIVLLDKPKGRKTFTLINTARGYLSRSKNVMYIDTENGEHEIMDRMIQSTLGKTKREILSGDFDDLEEKQMKKYKMLKSNFFVKQVPALNTTVNDIESIIKNFEREKGIKIHVVMIDYAGKLGTTSSYTNREDFDRIQKVYVDLENLGKSCDLDCIWTAQHTTRDSAKKKASRYSEEDIAGCISIIRNATAVIGINSTESEEESGFQRLEIVVQRDGLPFGRALLEMDLSKQKMKEPSPERVEAYNTFVAPEDADETYDNKEKYKKYYDQREKKKVDMKKVERDFKRKNKHNKFKAPKFDEQKYMKRRGDLPR